MDQYQFHVFYAVMLSFFYLLSHMQSKTFRFNIKVKYSLGGKEHRQENAKEDYELGYSDFTLSFKIHLPHSQQKKVQLPLMHKNEKLRLW